MGRVQLLSRYRERNHCWKISYVDKLEGRPGVASLNRVGEAGVDRYKS